jgi:hypothetical protein
MVDTPTRIQLTDEEYREGMRDPSVFWKIFKENGIEFNNTKKKMNNLKKYLDSFNWYDLTNEKLLEITPEAKLRPEYPSNFETQFGKIPSVFLRITDKILPHNKFKAFQKYLTSEGFSLLEAGYESYKYVHYDKKILINGDTTREKPVEEYDEDEVDDGENIYKIPRICEPEELFITLLPTIENRKFIEGVIKKINNYLIDVSKQVDKFYMIAQNPKGLFTQKTNFKSIGIKDDRYDLFYGEKFPHEKMHKFVTDVTDNLMLIHGDPGTGKSNYIKHLITNSKKKVIYIPPSMLSVISSPGFVTFMMENRNSILLIEDAEEVLSVDRNSATNNLLGLTDGFLKDSLGLKVIATFNCNIGKIDPALMRKGRMYLEYKFDRLTVDECRNLATFLKIEREVKAPMTLAEFFNVEENTVENSFEERRIGFV